LFPFISFLVWDKDRENSQVKKHFDEIVENFRVKVGKKYRQ